MLTTGAALFPLVFVPLTESSGRMPGYFVSGPAHSYIPKLDLMLDLLLHFPHLPDPIRRRDQLRDDGDHEVLWWRGELGGYQSGWREYRRYLEGPEG